MPPNRPPRGPDKGPRKNSPRRGRPGARSGLRAPRDPHGARRAAALVHLADGLLPRVAAERIGVSQATVYNWLREASFSAELHHELAARRAAAQALAAAHAVELVEELLALGLDRPSRNAAPVLEVSPGITLTLDPNEEQRPAPADLAKLRMVRVLALREALKLAGVEPPKVAQASEAGEYALHDDATLLQLLEGLSQRLLAPPPEPEEVEAVVELAP